MTNQDSITIFVESTELLRKGWRGLEKAREEFRAGALETTLELGIEPLLGPVAVELSIHAPPTGQQPQTPGVVKAYLDALEGIAYHEDRQVEHLDAQRFALDHPMLVHAEAPEPASSKAAVFAEITPLDAYTEVYDRAYRSTWFRRNHSPWLPSWTPRKEARLIEARRLKKSEPTPASASLVRSLEEEKLRSGFLADIDRPGPLPRVTKAIHRFLPLPRLHQTLRQRQGAWFLLPLPGQEEGSSERWRTAVNEQILDFKQQQKGLPFGGFVALDVAVRGESLQGKDLDNLVHGFLVPFEQGLCVARGTVSGYRTYSAPGEPLGVQVRVLDDAILLNLRARLHETRAKPTLEERLQGWTDSTTRLI